MLKALSTSLGLLMLGGSVTIPAAVDSPPSQADMETAAKAFAKKTVGIEAATCSKQPVDGTQ
jgi:hypothetical protein